MYVFDRYFNNFKPFARRLPLTYILQGNLAQHYCAKVTKYKDLSIDTSGCLLDFAFCEVDNHRGALANNRPCQSNIIIEDIESTLDHKS